MGTKGAKAGNIYSSLKSRGLVGADGKDPMLNLGSAAKYGKPSPAKKKGCYK